ncbi:MAG: hypothetical protein ABI831_17650, partial [Betaproteobacteria bacterium]
TGAALAVSGSAFAQNISQNQSGWGNSQSISIGNVDGKAPAKKKGKKVSSTQDDPSTGNTQSVNADSGGNISQNQSGRNNAQSIEIGGNVNGGKTPSVTQTQTGANKKQSIVVDGKKVEKKQE